MKGLDKKKKFFMDIENKIPETICEAGEDEENDISAVDIESEHKIISTKNSSKKILDPTPKKSEKEQKKKKKNDSDEDNSEASSEEDKKKKKKKKQ